MTADAQSFTSLIENDACFFSPIHTIAPFIIARGFFAHARGDVDRTVFMQLQRVRYISSYSSYGLIDPPMDSDFTPTDDLTERSRDAQVSVSNRVHEGSGDDLA